MRFIRNVSIASLLLALTACGGGGSANGTTASGGEGLTVVSFSPTSFRALDPGFTLTVNGTGFDSTSVVLWNGVALPTKVISATKIQAAVPTADTATDLEPSFAVENNHSLSDTSEYFFLSVVAPTPKITQVLPSLVVVGSQAAEIDVKGKNFVNGAYVMLGGKVFGTTVNSPNDLVIDLSSSDLAVAQTTSITVFYREGYTSKEGQTSNSSPFSIGPAAPVLGALSPSYVVTGSQDATLSIIGKNFLSGDIVEWNGLALATTYVSATRLQATVPAALSATPTAAQITVHYSGPGASSSVTTVFSVETTVPQSFNLNPGSVLAGDAGLIMTVEGSGFTPASTVSWDGGTLSTIYLSPNQLQVSIPATFIQNIGMHDVSVTTGVTTSSQLTFLAGQAGGYSYSYIKVAQPAGDIVWNASQAVFYLSVPSTTSFPPGVPPNHDSVVVLDSKSGTITQAVSAGTSPGALGISDDDQYLYVSENKSAAIQRFTLPTLAADINCPLGTDSQSRPHYAIAMDVKPGGPHTIAAVIDTLGIGPASVGLLIMDDCTQRANVASAYGVGLFAVMDSIQWSADGRHVYASDDEVIGGDNLFDATVDANGASLTAEYSAPSLSPIHYEPSNGYLYQDMGFIVNASDGTEAGWFGAPSYGVGAGEIMLDSEDPTLQLQIDGGAMIQDANLDTAFFAETGGLLPSFGACTGVAAFTMSTQAFMRGLVICGSGGSLIKHVVRWGSNGLAFIDLNGNVFLLAGNFVSGQ